MKTNQRVLIIDGDEIRRAGIMRLLELMDETFIVDEIENPSKIIFNDEKHFGDEETCKYDLLILSDASKNYAYTSEISTIRKKFPGTFIVTSLPPKNNVYDILKLIVLGTSGIIPGNCSIGEMRGIIQQALCGMVVFPSRILDAGESVSDAGLRIMGTESFNAPFGQLTKRQTAVLGLLVQGKSNHEIAERLGIAENTVRVHLSAILKTLNASNRTQAAIIASTYLRSIEESEVETPLSPAPLDVLDVS